MSNYTDKAQALRDDVAVHYNCAQAVLLAFADKAGLSAESAASIAANFGSGMKQGSVCGAVTGGLMVLGLFGITDTARFYSRIIDAVGKDFNCATLLKLHVASGAARKQHCDRLIASAVSVVEEILMEQGKL